MLATKTEARTNRRRAANCTANYKPDKDSSIEINSRNSSSLSGNAIPYLLRFLFFFSGKILFAMLGLFTSEKSSRFSLKFKRRTKGGEKKKPCPSVVEVTEIRWGAAWWVNGMEALRAERWGGEGRGAALLNPSCLPVSTDELWEDGGKKGAPHTNREFLWGFKVPLPLPLFLNTVATINTR